jgi:hypothetical protein
MRRQRKMQDPWKTLEVGLAAFEPRFKITREQPLVQQRPANTAVRNAAKGKKETRR